MGFWERTFKAKESRSRPLAFPTMGGSGKSQDHLGLKPCMIGSQLPDTGSHAGMRAMPGASPGDVMTQCSIACGSWLLPLCHPEISTQRHELGSSLWMELPLHHHLEWSGSTSQTLRQGERQTETETEIETECCQEVMVTLTPERTRSCRDGDLVDPQPWAVDKQ